MKALLLKDLIAQRWNILFGALYSLIFILAFSLVGEAPQGGFIYIVSGVVVGYMVLLGSFSADKNDTPRFLLSLPATRGDAVNEKFLLLFLATTFGTICAVAIGAVAAIISSDVATVEPMYLLRIAGGMLAISFVIPFYFRFGHQMIRYLIFALMGVGVIAQIVAMLLLTFARERGGPVALFDAIMRFVRSGANLERNLWFVGIGAVICLASYLASRLIYLRREI